MNRKFTMMYGLAFALSCYNIQLLIAGNSSEKRFHHKSGVENNKTKAQSRLSGIVTDKAGRALPGVTVLEKGTSNGTSTDLNGNFNLTTSEESGALIFSLIGFVKKEVPFSGAGKFSVTLEDDMKSLEEVVVVGYGTRQKSQLTGAISSVSASEIQSVPVTSADHALQGRAAGVDVVASGNNPGAGSTIRIRGTNSITAGNDPLFVIDGIPSGGLSDINPNIIESMEILKDASATAIYGARGSNGVVLITTKRGKEGKTRINYDSYIGVSKILNKVEMLDAEGWVRYKRISKGTDQLDQILDPIELKNYEAGNSVDWQNFNLRNGRQQNHSLGILGGNQKTKFSISANFLEQQGIVYNSDFTRGSFQINLDHQINDRFKVGTSTILSTSKESIINLGQVLGQASRIGPLGDVYNGDGTLRLFPTSEALLGNPMLDLENDKNRRNRTRIFSSLFAEYEFVKGLKYRLNFGPDFTFVDNGRFIGSNTSTLQGAENRARNEKNDTKAYTLENILSYNRTFNEIHNLDVTLLHSVQEEKYEGNLVEVQGLPSENMLWHDLSAGQIRDFDSDQREWSILSYMARINYSLKDRYLLTLTARRDGSSRFGEDKKYGFFPSAAIAWRIKQESFMDAIPAITDLKLRASYGEIGNTALNPYQSMGSLSLSSYLFGSDVGLGFQPGTLPNVELMWETSRQLNLGFDFGLLKNRLTGSLEYYQTVTDDLLLNRALAPHTGYSNALTNIGSTKNTGLEFGLTTINIDSDNGFRWTTSLNAAINKNEIVDLYGNKMDDVGNKRFIGEPITVYYDQVFDGIWQLDEAEEAASYGRTPGQIKLKDLNNDGQINAEDREIIGSPFPDWSGGITNNFRFKGFDLSVFVNIRQGFMIESGIYGLDNLEGRFNIPTFVNYWTPENPSNDFPKPVRTGANNPNMSVLRYRDGSFVRVRNINLGYNFANKLIKPIGLQSLRVYVSAQNPFTFTKFKGWDSEAGSGIDSYPSAKMALLGVNVSF